MAEELESQESQEPVVDTESVETEKPVSETETEKEGADVSVPKSKYDELHGRTVRAEEEAKRAKAKLAALEGEKPRTAKKLDVESRIEEKVDLRMSGFSKAEIDKIEKYASGAGITLTEAAKDEVLLAGIQAMRAKQKSQAATPAPSRRSAFSVEEVSKLKPAERAQKMSFDAWKQQRRIKTNSQE